jgi:hypothetical protein
VRQAHCPTALDKNAGKTGGYYPDFSVWELALPILIVEAKEPEVPVAVGYREAALYSHRAGSAKAILSAIAVRKAHRPAAFGLNYLIGMS